MVIIGQMFKKKLIECMAQLKAGKKKMEWFSRFAERKKKERYFPMFSGAIANLLKDTTKYHMA